MEKRSKKIKNKQTNEGGMRVGRQFRVKGCLHRTGDTCFIGQKAAGECGSGGVTHLWVWLGQVFDLDPGLFAFFWLGLLPAAPGEKINGNKKNAIQRAASSWRERSTCAEKQSGRLLVFLSPELLCAVIKELLVHLHEELQGVVDEAVDGPGNTPNTSV